MAPSNPWSPNWRPDPTGRRLRMIRVARRGAVLAALVYVGVAIAVVLLSAAPREYALPALVVGLPGVALLGAGLGPATTGSRIDAVVAGIAFAIGIPVAAVTSIVIGAFVLGFFLTGVAALPGEIIRAAVTSGLRVEPIVALGAAVWVVGVRWLSRPRRVPNATTAMDDRPGPDVRP